MTIQPIDDRFAERRMAASARRAPVGVVIGSMLGMGIGNGPIIQFTFGIFLKPVSAELHADRGTMSLAVAAALTLTGLVVPWYGRKIDQFGIRAVAVPSIILFSAVLLLLGFVTTSVTIFILLYAVMGLVSGGQTSLPYARAISETFSQRRGLALGFAMAGTGLGSALLPPFVQLLIGQYGWRAGYIGLGLLQVAVAWPCMVFLVSTSRRGHVASDRSQLVGSTIGEALRSRVFWAMAISFFFAAMAIQGVMAQVVPLLTDQGIPAQSAALAISTAGLSLIAGRVVSGYLLDRIFAPFVAAGLFTLPLVGVLMLLTPAGLPLALVATALVGLGLGGELDILGYLLPRYFGFRSFGEIYGYMFAFFMLGTGTGSLVMGVSFARLGSYKPALMLFVAVLAVASLLIGRVGPYRYGKAGPQQPA